MEGGNPTLLRSGASYVLNPRALSRVPFAIQVIGILLVASLHVPVYPSQDEDPPHPHDRICKARKASQWQDVEAIELCIACFGQTVRGRQATAGG